jgi:hypothetical protein
MSSSEEIISDSDDEYQPSDGREDSGELQIQTRKPPVRNIISEPENDIVISVQTKIPDPIPRPRKGGRRRKESVDENVLMDPPSPRTKNDPELMGLYRTERNRLAAKRSRDRKRDYIDSLCQENKFIRGYASQLEKENAELRRQLVELKGQLVFLPTNEQPKRPPRGRIDKSN